MTRQKQMIVLGVLLLVGLLPLGFAGRLSSRARAGAPEIPSSLHPSLGW